MGGEGKPNVAKVGGIFQIDILDKKGNGSCKEGGDKAANATFVVGDQDFFNICNGTLNPQMAFVQGKMKIKGSMPLATKFTPQLFPKPTPENIAKYAKAKL